MRGISFIAKRSVESDKLLYSILKGINFDTYIWKVVESEIYKTDEETAELFSREIYNGIDFENIIKFNEYQVIFANIQAYKRNTQIYELNNYEEFLASSCEIVVLIVDCRFVEIYSKSHITIEQIKSNVERLLFEDIEYITDDNDTRTRFSIW